jgi:hypothetical protein
MLYQLSYTPIHSLRTMNSAPGSLLAFRRARLIGRSRLI